MEESSKMLERVSEGAPKVKQGYSKSSQLEGRELMEIYLYRSVALYLAK